MDFRDYNDHKEEGILTYHTPHWTQMPCCRLLESANYPSATEKNQQKKMLVFAHQHFMFEFNVLLLNYQS